MSKKFEIEKIEKFDFNGEPVLFAISNGAWLNATKVAKAGDKRMDKFWESAETKAYIKALGKLKYPSEGDLKHTTRGRNGGTYIHPRLVLFFAQWVSPEFHIECNKFLEYHMAAKADATAHRLREEKEKMLHQHSVQMKELDKKREECEAKIKEYNEKMKEQKDLLIAATALESAPKKRKPVGRDKGFGSVRQWLQLRIKAGKLEKMSLREVFDKLESKAVRKVTHEKVVNKRYRIMDETLGEDTTSGINVSFTEMDKIFICQGKKSPAKPKAPTAKEKVAKTKATPKAKAEVKSKSKPVKPQTKAKAPTKPAATKNLPSAPKPKTKPKKK